MNKKAVALLGLAAVGAGIFFVARQVSASSGVELEADVMYHLRYTGPTQTFQAALGSCWDYIYTIEVYDDYYGEWLPPFDPTTELIPTGADCMVQVWSPCLLENFESF